MSELIRAWPGDLDALSGVIAEAFHDLPPSRWLIGDETARRQVFPGYFRIHLEHALGRGVVYTTPDRAAAALWIPVGTGKPAPPDGYAERLADTTSLWMSRFEAFDTALESGHPAGTAHHHLALLGVRPGRQGDGLGSELLREHHCWLDQAGVPAYLEASTERNRRLYLRHGYRDIGPSIDLPGGPSLIPMWRDPLALCQVPAAERIAGTACT